MPLSIKDRPPLHMIKTRDASGITTMCGRRAVDYLSGTFAEASGNVIAAVSPSNTKQAPTCQKCNRAINAKKKSQVSNFTR